MDVAIFVRDISLEDAIRWMEGKLGPLVSVHTDDDMQILKNGPADITVIVTPHMEDEAFLGIEVSGHPPIWTRSEQLAIPCAVELGKTVQWCDEDTNGFMEKQGDGPAYPIVLDD